VWPLHKNDGLKAIMFASDVTEFVSQHPTLLRHTRSRGLPEVDSGSACQKISAEIQPMDFLLSQCSPQFNVFFLRRMEGESLVTHIENAEDCEQIVDAVQKVSQGHGAQQISISLPAAHGAWENSIGSKAVRDQSPMVEHNSDEDEDEDEGESKVWFKFSRRERVESRGLLDSAKDAIVVEVMHTPKHPCLRSSCSDTFLQVPSSGIVKSRSNARHVSGSRKTARTFDNSQFDSSPVNSLELRRQELRCSGDIMLSPSCSTSSYDSMNNHSGHDGMNRATGKSEVTRVSKALSCDDTSGFRGLRTSSIHDSEGGTIVSEFCEELRIESLCASSIEEHICCSVASWGTETDSAGPQRVVARALELFSKHAKGGALMAVVPREELKGLEKITRTADGRYLTAKLRRVHILTEEFKQIFISSTDHSSEECDRWPTNWPDEEGRNQPKDGAMLVSTTGYRLMCAAKLVGLPKAYYRWPKGVGARHETALQLACHLEKAIVFVRSDSGSLHVFSVLTSGGRSQMRVYRVDEQLSSNGSGPPKADCSCSSELLGPVIPYHRSSSSKSHSSNSSATPPLWRSMYNVSGSTSSLDATSISI